MYSETLGDWRNHNGADYAADKGDKVHAVTAGTVAYVTEAALWGTVAEVKTLDGGTWRYCGLDKADVKTGDEVHRGDVLGTVGTIPSEGEDASHLHLEYLDENGAYQDPEDNK